MMFSLHIPDAKSEKLFRDKIKEAKALRGQSQFRILYAALCDYVTKLKKESV